MQIELFKNNKEASKSLKLNDFINDLQNSNCVKCRLGQVCEGSRTKIVVSRGSQRARIVLLGEGPGAVEDQCGQPFMGPAGKLTDQMFASIGLDTNLDIYVTNAVKCKPPPENKSKLNGTPKWDEIQACRPYLLEELTLLDNNDGIDIIV